MILDFDAGCGIIVISSFIFNGFRSESFDGVKLLRWLVADMVLLAAVLELIFLPSIAFLATVLCAVYTCVSNCLYMPKVAVQTVHLYERWAGFKVM